MGEKQVIIGLDRYLACKWADYALELFLSPGEEQEKYQKLKHYMKDEIAGSESAEKTASQLRRLWLNNEDSYRELRDAAARIIHNQMGANHTIYHFGMAINVFPIFRETCRRIGEIAAVQHDLNRAVIIDRVSQNYANPSSIPRIVRRVIQTLAHWGFLDVRGNNFKVVEISISDYETGRWLVQAVMSAENRSEISASLLNNLPINIGIRISDVRTLLRTSEVFTIRRKMDGEETISAGPLKY